MDGKRCVGRARPRSGGQVWLARLYGACWIDTIADSERGAKMRERGIRPNFAADLKVVKTKAKARKLLKELARVSP